MEQLILHGIGDFWIQADKWALNKKKKGQYGFWCCFIHCFTYSLPFLFIGSWLATLVIFITHFIIDRTNIVAYLLAWKNGVYENKELNPPIYRGVKMIPQYYKRVYNISNFGFGLERPFAISIWLYIICDNLLHIICNYVALTYL